MLLICNVSRKRTLALLLCASVMPRLAAAQGSAEYASGGLISWPWIEEDSSNPGQYLLWTAEEGGRIRFETIANPSSPATTTRWLQDVIPVPGDPPFRSILRDVEVLGVKGIAVGDHASWAWAFHPELPNTAWPASPVVWAATMQSIGDVRLWDVDYDGSTAYVVGEGGLVARTVNPTPASPAPVLITPANFVGQAPLGEMRGIDFSGSLGIAVGDMQFDAFGNLSWGLHYTTDGQNWHLSTVKFTTPQGEHVTAAPNEQIELFRVDFVDGTSIAYAVGGFGSNAGYIFRTEDGGSSWLQELHECAGLNHGQCYGSQFTCTPATVPCGTSPVSLNTHWARLNGLYGVAAFSDESATAVGYSGMVVTRDNSVAGPRKWREISTRCDLSTMPLWGVHGNNLDTAVLVGMPEQIQVTADGGWTWNRMTPLAGLRFQAATATSSGVGGAGGVWMVGQDCRITRSDDEGGSWTTQFAFASGPDKVRKLTAIAAYDDQDGDPDNDVVVAVGDPRSTAPLVNDRPTVLVSIDGGASCWQLQTATDLGMNVGVCTKVLSAGVDPVSGEPLFWIVGNDELLLRGAISASPQWTPFAPTSVDPALTSTVDWTDVAFDGPSFGWLRGDVSGNQVAYFTSNGEAATPVWSAVQIPTGVTLTQFSATGFECFAAGKDSSSVWGVWRSNGGAFVPMSSPTLAEALTSIAATGGANPVIFLGGQHGLLWRGSGSPITWTEERSLTSLVINGMTFFQPSNGYLFGGPQGEETEGGGANTLIRWR